MVKFTFHLRTTVIQIARAASVTLLLSPVEVVEVEFHSGSRCKKSLFGRLAQGSTASADEVESFMSENVVGSRTEQRFALSRSCTDSCELKTVSTNTRRK